MSREREPGPSSIKSLVERVVPSLKGAAEILKLDSIIAGWSGVVGPELARRSRPFELLKGELLVAVDGSHVGSGIVRMRGNIIRALKRKWDIEVTEVRVRVIYGTPLPRARPSSPSPRRRAPAASADVVDEEELAALKARFSLRLPEDVASALARFLLFQERRGS
ncbi:MAG: DUF721 domain-containing protein [Fretibacterium sp.]|nr:DUF721 domain-containing protein [Fretibacterium sp.]